MKYKEFDVLFIYVLARDIIDEQTVVRYMDEKGILKKLSISKVDYDILPNHKLLIAKLKINDDVIAYCKNIKDTIHPTSIFQNDEFYHSNKPQNSRFIDSDQNDIKELRIANLKRKAQPLLICITILIFGIIPFLSSVWTPWLLILSFVSILSAFLLCFSGFFEAKTPITELYDSTYTDFKLDFNQRLTDNRHLF